MSALLTRYAVYDSSIYCLKAIRYVAKATRYALCECEKNTKER